MTEETKKFLAIGAVVVCLGIAGTVTYKTFFGDGGGVSMSGDVPLLCTTCGGFEIPMKQFQEIMSKNPMGMMPGMPGQQMVIDCPKCNKKTCYPAQKCPKCQNIFVFGQARDQNFPDRCPKCKFSEYEDMQKNPSK